MIEKFKWITWSVLPLVYDESLSYVELLNKVIDKLNEVIDATNDFTVPVQKTIEEWLKSTEGKTAIEQVIGEFIQQYAHTPDFQTVLNKALENQTDEIKQAATAATNAYLKTTEGTEILEVEVAAFMNSYVKSPAFQELVKEFIAELNDILRGDNLDIKQKKTASIYTRNARIASAELANDYSVNRTFNSVDVNDTGISMGDPNDLSAKVTKAANFSFKPLYMGFSTGDNKNQIKMLAEPTDKSDAATKQYVDTSIEDAVSDITTGYVVRVRCYEETAGKWTITQNYAWIKNQIDGGSTVVLIVEDIETEFIGYSSDAIVFGQAVCYPKNQSASSKNGEVDHIDGVIARILPNGNVIVNCTKLKTTEYVRVDGANTFRAAQSMGNNRLTNLAAPLNMQDAANKQYVDTKAYLINNIRTLDDGSYISDYSYAEMASEPLRFVLDTPTARALYYSGYIKTRVVNEVTETGYEYCNVTVSGNDSAKYLNFNQCVVWPNNGFDITSTRYSLNNDILATRVNELSADVVAIEANVKNLNDANKDLIPSVNKLTADVATIETNVKNLTDTNNVLVPNVNKLTADVATIETNVGNLTTTTDEILVPKVNELTADVATIETNVGNLTNTVANLTKKQSEYLPLSGGTMSGGLTLPKKQGALNFGNIHVDASSKSDNTGSMGILELSQLNQDASPETKLPVLLKNVAAPIDIRDAANKHYVDAGVAGCVQKTGSTMTGALTLPVSSGLKLGNIVALTALNETEGAPILVLWGTNSVTGAGFQECVLSSIADPVDGNDATNMSWVNNTVQTASAANKLYTDQKIAAIPKADNKPQYYVGTGNFEDDSTSSVITIAGFTKDGLGSLALTWDVMLAWTNGKANYLMCIQDADAGTEAFMTLDYQGSYTPNTGASSDALYGHFYSSKRRIEFVVVKNTGDIVLLDKKPFAEKECIGTGLTIAEGSSASVVNISAAIDAFDVAVTATAASNGFEFQIATNHGTYNYASETSTAMYHFWQCYNSEISQYSLFVEVKDKVTIIASNNKPFSFNTVRLFTEEPTGDTGSVFINP